MKKAFAAIALVLIAVPAFSADTFAVDPKHSTATFKIRHLVSSVTGKFETVSGTLLIDRANPAASSVEFKIKADSINTAVEERDKHLRSSDFFDVAKYSDITFKSTKVAPTTTPNVYDVTGSFSMHGVTRQITFPVTFLGFGKDPWGNQVAGFELETLLDRKDYGITWNKVLDQGGLLLGDEVKVSIALEAVKQ